jgi:hypothetical protein
MWAAAGRPEAFSDVMAIQKPAAEDVAQRDVLHCPAAAPPSSTSGTPAQNARHHQEGKSMPYRRSSPIAWQQGPQGDFEVYVPTGLCGWPLGTSIPAAARRGRLSAVSPSPRFVVYFRMSPELAWASHSAHVVARKQASRLQPMAKLSERARSFAMAG